jgi:sRNA-binding carbon storage regulator CsrA
MRLSKNGGKLSGLFLTRNVGQSITIDGSMTITVVEVTGRRVRLCFSGHQQVLRTEVQKEKEKLSLTGQ